MRVADGFYHLFHHQGITLQTDQQNCIIKELNIHTDIQHITDKNSYLATVAGIHGRSDFHSIPLVEYHETKPTFTKRQRELLPYFIKGYSNIEIANAFNVSIETIRQHNKHILTKTKAKNTAGLLKRCLELGIL